MAQVLPAERDLRRVIGDGDTVPDGEVDGLTDHDLVELYRSLVLLRTYDERSVVYHSQGRIGTYAIYWNHEAMQAGSVHALADDDWIFPSYRESAIGLLRGMPASTVLSWWRGHPAGWWNPADYNVASICVPIGTHVPHAAGLAWGKRLRGENACAIAYFGDGATSEGSFHEGANFAAVMRAPLVLFCNNNGWAISTPVEAQTRAETLADKAVGYGMPAARVDGLDILAVYEATREAVARARAGEGPTFIEAVSYRAAPHATADDPKAYIDLERVEEEKKRECVGRYEGYLRRAGSSRTRWPSRSGPRPSRRCATGSRRPRRSRPRIAGLLFEHAYVDPPACRHRSHGPRRARGMTDDGPWRGSVAELTFVEAINDCFHVELGPRRERDGHGRGRRPRGRRLPRDGRAARQVRPGSLRRHAARRGGDHRQRDRPVHGRVPAGLRDAVRRLQLPGARPADHARRPLPLADRRPDDVPADRAHAVRRRCPRAGAARRLARGLLRAHAGREGGDPLDAE